MPKFTRYILAAALLAALGGCALPRGAALQSEVLRGSKDETADFAVVPVSRANVDAVNAWPRSGGLGGWPEGAAGRGPLIIKPGDSIDMVIWDSQENSLLAPASQKQVDIKGLKVSSGGVIFIPYLDQIKVSGLSAEEARSLIQTKLEPIVPSAQVQLSLSAGSDNTVDIVHGVARPGRFPIPDRSYSILSLLSDAGGVAQGLENPIVRLQRGGKTYSIAASDIYDSSARNIGLRGGDRVIVEADDRYFMALGATGKEELVYFPKSDLTALEALSIIGGVNDARANLKGVLILREYSDKAIGRGPTKRQTVFTFDLTSVDGLFAARNFKINPKDVVLATESPIGAAQSLFGVIAGVFNLAGRASNL